MAHIGFDKLAGMLAAKGARNPAGLARYIGRKKYGAEGFNALAAAGRAKKSLGHGGQRAALHAGMERRTWAAEFEVRAKPDGTGGSRYALRGYASVYDKPYRMIDKFGEYEERVRPGAGRKTLSERPDVVLLLNHGGMPMARTKNGSLHLSEDSTGLLAEAPDLNGERQLVRDTIAAVEERLLDEMSFAFRVPEGRSIWSDDYSRRDIAEYSLHRGDVSVVTFGANPNTNVALRAEDLDVLDDDAARAVYERLARRFAVPQTPPAGAMSLRLAVALAQAQG